MNFLNICTNPDILRLIYFGFKILKIVFIILPIVLIALIVIDLSKAMIGDEKAAKTSKKQIINRVIFAGLIFFVPTIVAAVMNLISNVGFNSGYMECINNANMERIQELTIEIAEEKLEIAENELTKLSIQQAKSAISKIKDNNKKQQLEQRLNRLKPNSNNQNNENNNSSNNTDNNNFENLASGIERKYFSPIQDKSKIKSYGSLSTTPGCGDAKVYHDVSAYEGTPLYAAADGKAQFYQRYCPDSNELYSYGNMVKLITNDNTEIIYAHLQKFPSNVLSSSSNNRYITATCNQKKCSYTDCKPGVKSNNIATLNVKKGDLIGYVGTTGNSSGPHLHIEIKPQGTKNCTTNPWEAFGLK